MNLWSMAGYSQNPYSVAPLPPTSEGADLLVGRDKELNKLLVQLRSMTTHPTIEGENGVGKTSLVLVAGYKAEVDFVAGKTQQLFLPLPEPLQIAADAASFERSVSFSILQAYLKHAATLDERGYFVPDLEDVRRWIASPLIQGGGGGASVMGFGANATVSLAANTSVGYAESGLRSQLVEWLKKTFPNIGSGAFIGIVDNLEILERSNEARRVLEAIRDGALNLPGTRWVLCGAKGIVRSAASTPRLAGRISSPIELKPVSEDLVPELLRRRLAHFSEKPDAAPPVDPEAFNKLYRVSNKNLRTALKHAEDFAVWLFQEEKLSAPAAEKQVLLANWISEVADEFVRDANLQDAQWKLFDRVTEEGGSIAPGDYEQFGYNSSQAMRFHVGRLERANLVDSVIDEEDLRRRTISITPIGWLVRHRRSMFQNSKPE
ncbi:hypothetical protein [Actinoplanes sp. G11-F43]|uniref:hypothetical protein n=1 Tax=Actinoplanes sp. G11-F43 TaxID=3424130 RepID=UPI003D334AEA